MTRLIHAFVKLAAISLAVFSLAWLAVRALDSELDAHSHAAFGAEYDPAE